MKSAELARATPTEPPEGVGPNDRCVCGSGLPYRLCHGRTPGTDEVLLGKF